ncbi:Glycosyltransferase involved in cell wall bisynthesis [Rhizobium sp. RU20A]|uniref:glycosyltransferase family 4 protein n=1 Tax=Rhizobium sp. RU20A TaxID=1907412 RepID=UPI000953F186|nr:glycosyltransferase family 1 protein [Rhizobium sp. RU20A]SIQ59134.1 Glycosyltransferase involved in cell wall bisynthesis [Rhizobium sp. RU20A]
MRILLDVTRTLVHSKKSTPTGIDRVEHAYIRYFLSSPLAENVFFLANSALGRGALTAKEFYPFFRKIEDNHERDAQSETGENCLKLLSTLAAPPSVDRLSPLSLRSGDKAAADSIWSVANAVIRGRKRFQAMVRDGIPTTYFHVSHLQLDDPRCFRWLEAPHIEPFFFVHDLIPIEFPEFCSPRAAERHGRRMETILRHARGILVNSHFTEASLQRYVKQRNLPECRVVPLANKIQTRDIPAFADFRADVPFFIHVGTIEGRKNISHILTVWRALIERLGPLKAPRLVIVGRRGWECETVVSALDRSRDLANHVIEVSGLRDGELYGLMRKAAGLITVSITEGFGLPPVEAARLGLPVIASDIPAHREVLSDAATFVGIHDGEGLLREILSIMSGEGRANGASPPLEFSWDMHVDLALRSIDEITNRS